MSVRTTALVCLLGASCAPQHAELPAPRPAKTLPVPLEVTAAARVQRLLERGQLRAARKLLTETLRVAPTDALRCQLVEVATALGDDAAADSQLRELDSARARPSGCELERLRSELERTTRLERPRARTLIEAGQLASARGEPAHAQRLFDRALSELERKVGTSVSAEPLRRFEQTLFALESSPSGKQLAAADSVGLSVLDADFEEVFRLPLTCRSVAWQAETSLLCGAADGRLLAIDLENAGLHVLARLPGPVTCAVAQGERWLVVGGGQALLSNAPGSVQRLGVAGASAGAFSPDAQRVAIGGHDGSLTLLDAATLKTRLRVAASPARAALTNLRFSQDGVWLGVSFEDGPARVLRAASGQLRALVPVTGQFRFSADGQRWVAAGASYRIGAPLDTRAIAGGPPVVLSPSRVAAIWLGEGGALHETGFEGEDDVVLRPAPERLDHGWSVPLQALASAVAHAGNFSVADAAMPAAAVGCGDDPGTLSPDGQYELCARATHELELLDARSRRSLWRVSSPILPIGLLDVSPARALVLVGSAQGAGVLLSLAEGRLLARVWSSAQRKAGENYAMRGYATDDAGHLQLIVADPNALVAPARCAVGPWRLPFAACRQELLDPLLLERVLLRAAGTLQK